MSNEETAFVRLLRKVFKLLQKGQPCPRCRGTGGTVAEQCRECEGRGFL